MPICNSYLANDIEASCSVGKGYYDEAVIINYDDIKSKTMASSDDTEVTVSKLVIATGKKGYKVEQLAKNAFDGSQTELEVGDVRSTWTHTLSFKIFSDKKNVASICNNLSNGTFVMVVKGKVSEEGGANKYLIYGLTNGLTASEITREGNGDNGFVINVTLTEEDSASFVYYLYDTDEATTETAFQKLLVTAE